MAAPTINSVSPARGLSLGDTFVVITGAGFNVEHGTLKVYFGDQEATEYGAVSATQVIARTPGGPVGAVDVTVQNLTLQDPNPPIVEGAVLPDGFTFHLPAIDTRPDYANDQAILLVHRWLVLELRRTVIANVSHEMHPEYSAAEDAALAQETQAEAPSLKLVGPTLQEDRFYAHNGDFNVDDDISFSRYSQPTTVRMDYQFVGVGRTSGEAMNLWAALARYFNRTGALVVPKDGADTANGTVSFELDPSWEQTGEFSRPVAREGFHQFSGSFSIRGVHVLGEKVSEGREVNEDGFTIDDGIVQYE